jgi:DNA (cytosine-5)-methyltransferase 1
VTAGVAKWVGDRLAEPGTYDPTGDEPLSPGSRWPNAAWGGDGEAFVAEASFWPRLDAAQHLSDVAVPAECRPLSHRGAAGFLNRANRGQLRFVEEFMLDVKEHVELTAP